MTVTANRADWTPLAGAIQTLAAACDGARTEDGQGFSAGNVPLGHYLSKIPGELWDDTMAAGAWQICREHKAQLAANGIELEDLPVPPEPERDARGELAEQRRAFEAAERIKTESVCVLADDGGQQVIVLGFPYDQDMVDEARELPGRAWKPEFGAFTKVNVFPAFSAPQVRGFCDRHGIPVPAGVAKLADNPPAPPTVAERGPNVYFLTDKTLAVKFDSFPGADTLAAVKELPGRKWDGESKVWTVPVSALSPLCEFAAGRGLRLAQDVADAAGGVGEREQWNEAASVALTPSGTVDVPGLSGTLKPHQVAGLEFIAANRRVLVGDKMGLGKTLLSLAALAANQAWPAVVVCKTSLRLNWSAEIGRFFPDRTVYVASGNAPEPVPAGTDVVVIGFDVLKQTYKAGGAEKPGWAAALAKLKPAALIVDESHFGLEKLLAQLGEVGATIAAERNSRIWYGAKYDHSYNMTTVDIAKCIREEIKLARKLAKDNGGSVPALIDPIGDAPVSIKFSVRSQYFSGGSAIDIRLTGVPQAWGWEQRRDEWGRMRWMYTPAMKALMDELKHVMAAYNHDGSDIMTDYFDVRFYGSVETDWTEDPNNSRAA